MDATFWHRKWEVGEIGFHKSDVNPIVTRYFKDIKPDQRILVPLCGKSLDMLWLRERAHVIGCELSGIAVEQFFSENKLTPKKINIDGYEKFVIDKLEIYQADFFSLSPNLTGPIDQIYDRAAAVALPPQMRVQYYNHLKQFRFKRMVMVILNYDQSIMNGPPFSVSLEEIKLHFQDYQIEVLEELTTEDNPPILVEHGKKLHQLILQLSLR